MANEFEKVLLKSKLATLKRLEVLYIVGLPILVSVKKPRLLIAKGSFATMGGAERDLMRVLPFLQTNFDVSLATLKPVPELEQLCDRKTIPLIYPSKNWKIPQSALSAIFNKVHSSSVKAWKSCKGLTEFIEKADMFYAVSGDGYLGFLNLIPKDAKAHLQLHEPHRGLHEDSLHRHLDGPHKRPLLLTKLMLYKSRKTDLKIVKKFAKRMNSSVSGNSNYSSTRARKVYGIETSVLWPCVDFNEFTKDIDDTKSNPVNSRFETDYVVSVGVTSWAKGVWEVVKMLRGSNLALVQVGGGSEKNLEMLRRHAQENNVNLWICPRISSEELAALMRGARAVVSMAHREPFGLTPIEAFAVGTPALFVDEGGFRDTITDGVCGRLLPRNDYSEWHKALHSVTNESLRKRWSETGRLRIETMGLRPEDQAKRIYELLK